MKKNGKRISAGLLAFRHLNNEMQVLIAHPGGPHNKNKDDGYWSIPKGKVEEGEIPYYTAFREFREETGIDPMSHTTGKILGLGEPAEQPRKFVYAWAFEYDGPKKPKFVSNLTTMEWPPQSGNFIEFPEMDEIKFVDCDTAKKKLHPAQSVFIDRLKKILENLNES